MDMALVTRRAGGDGQSTFDDGNAGGFLVRHQFAFEHALPTISSDAASSTL